MVFSITFSILFLHLPKLAIYDDQRKIYSFFPFLKSC